MNAKESAYDEHVSPLMAQIIALAKEHRINMFATFSLRPCEDDEPQMCTTSVAPDREGDPEGDAIVRRCVAVVRPQPQLLAITIIGGKAP